LCNIDAEKPAIGFKQVHVQLAAANKVSLPNLDHHTVFRHTLPGCVEQLSGQGVEHEVDSSSIRFPHHVCKKRGISGIEDAVARNAKRVDEVLDLLFFTYRCEDLRA
jgi:hypothetical protein